MNKILILLLGLTLSGCSLFQERVVIKEKYVFIPDYLLQNCDTPEHSLQLYEDVILGYLDLREALELCNTQINGIKDLQERLRDDQTDR